jgi:high-affinity nickel-transport protein
LELGGMAATILGLHVLGFGALLLAAHHVNRASAFGLGTGVLAYTLGMRHAFDADHLAAIDNTTRKLGSDGGRPLSVGFFFSLGHSSVVVLLCLGLGLGVHALGPAVTSAGSTLHQVTNVVGSVVSGGFLLLIGAVNAVALTGMLRVARSLRAGTFDEASLEAHLATRGFMNRFFGAAARRVDRPWKMYPVGLLFGLGFDTATEVGLLILAGTAAAGGVPSGAILALPILFTAGMCLLDTIDGCFMNVAYGWAFSNPARKVFYNLTMTGLSVAVAVGIGGLELLGLLAGEAHWRGAPWSTIEAMNTNALGLVVVALFIATWAGAVLLWRWRGLEERWRVRSNAHDDLPLVAVEATP